MSENAAPQTLVDEVKIPIEEAFALSVHDDVRALIDKGFYNVPKEAPVVVYAGPEVIAIAAAGKLRDRILPRSWSGLLGDRLSRLSPPPEVTPQTRLAALDFFVQEIPDADWLLVVDEKTGQPVGILSRKVALDHLPPLEAVSKGEVHRAAKARLWGDPEVEHVFYYCREENRHFFPHAVHPDAQGRMRDRKGHLVEEVVPPKPD